MKSSSAETPIKRALIVEGGAMRGIFSTGVLDGFLDRQCRPFDFCLGVSVGATNLAAWLAGQRGRNYKVITDYSCRPQFSSFRNFLAGGHWLDLDRFAAQPIPLYVAVTYPVASARVPEISAQIALAGAKNFVENPATGRSHESRRAEIYNRAIDFI